MTANKNNAACFTGHRTLSNKKIERIVKCLKEEIDSLIQQGVTDYITGGALGFDHIVASMIISKKEQGAEIRLIFALPCRNQDDKWTERQKQLYRSLLAEADEIIYVAEEYTTDCMKKRNFFMVENSAYCICALTKEISGTGQTVRYAQQQGLKVVNVAK